ncbi:hypothetical protein F8S13_14235 [Chloroflexia bacterium SDU3-3]|nr:hypothetical protein F8S13_14235 [Chloroflexia bacterium SDU3-3]
MSNSITLLIILIWGVATILLHIAFAAGVSRDASAREQRGLATHMVGPRWWMLAALLGGVLPAAIYWLLHYATVFTAPEPLQPQAERPEA